ncbi:MAG: peptide chain release factor N(5)-glutamine methyltransferase [Bacteroidota bacterium]
MNAQLARQAIISRLSPQYGPGESAAIARIVLEDAFGVKGLGSDTFFTDAQTKLLHSILDRLAKNEPVQYVLGQAQFFGLNFKVSPAVLIPRQETEELVAWVLEFLKDRDFSNPKVLDIGLGSGCIGITLKAKYKALQLFGLEKSKEALEVATENATQLLGAGQFTFWENDVLIDENWKQLPDFEVIVSNPPYIPTHEIALIPEHVRAHEPSLALFVDDDDPLIFYRNITALAKSKLVSGGALFFECNEFNAPEVGQLLEQNGFVGVEVKKDLMGKNRMVKGRVNASKFHRFFSISI